MSYTVLANPKYTKFLAGKFLKYTVIYGVYIRFWPILIECLARLQFAFPSGLRHEEPSRATHPRYSYIRGNESDLAGGG